MTGEVLTQAVINQLAVEMATKQDKPKVRKPVPQKPNKPIESKKDKERRKRPTFNQNQGELQK